MTEVMDPLKFVGMCWPDIRLYDKQAEILYSVRDNDETYVPAGNGLGKDFVSALCSLWFFCSRRPARIVTTSVKHDQLNDVLWGEIRRLLDSSVVKLPLQYNHMRIRQVRKDGQFVPLSELVGQVVNQGEAMLGRHLPRDIPRTLVIFDEASGIDSKVYESSDTWAHRKLIIGNPYPCTNFFYQGVKAGDLEAPGRDRYYRKVIKIKAEDSPNIRLAREEIRAGKDPSGTILIPGVVDYETLLKRRELWDKVRQCIGLDAEFYEGGEVLLFPPEWLNTAESLAESLPEYRIGEAMGVDPAEGGDSSCWSVVDHKGLIRLVSEKTPDTFDIPNITIRLMQEYKVPPEKVYFDAGGGGKQHADYLRRIGYPVNTVNFGETVKPDRRRGLKTLETHKVEDEERYVYKNRRAQMYGMIRELIDPTYGGDFAIPSSTRGPQYKELRRQLAPIPLLFDEEGRLYLPPKSKKDPNSKIVTLVELLGCSPDEADSLALGAYGLQKRSSQTIAGAAM